MLGPSGDQPPSSEPSGDAAAAFACFWQERRRAASLAAGESMWQHRPGWVFLKGHCVRSLWDGWGQVVGEGVQPLVRFLDGHECRMSADTLTYVPDDVFEGHIANRTEIEQALTSYVYGHEALHPSGCLWVRDEDGLWTTVERKHENRDCHPVIDSCFVDDIGDAHVPALLTGGAQVG
jgi:hypothetical protein